VSGPNKPECYITHDRKGLSGIKHSSLLGPFESYNYEENKLLWIWPQNLIRDNESLQRKLISQEEEFRIQNKTLLDELSKVVIWIISSLLLGLTEGLFLFIYDFFYIFVKIWKGILSFSVR
jgi:hypothetical protein